MPQIQGDPYSAQEVAFFYRHLRSNGKPTGALADGKLDAGEYQQLKQAYLKEVKPNLTPADAETLFQHLLADGLDGKLDRQSLTGLNESVQKLAEAHASQPNEVSFAPAGSFAGKPLPAAGITSSSIDSARKLLARQFQNLAGRGPDRDGVLAAIGKMQSSGLLKGVFPPNLDLQQALARLSLDDPKLSEAEVKARMQDLDKLADFAAKGKWEQVTTLLLVKQYSLDASGKPASPGMQKYINALPNMAHTGRSIFQVNNPERIKHTGKIASSQDLDPPVTFGVGEHQQAGMYGYASVEELTATGAVYEATVIRNTGTEPATVAVQGSGYANHETVLNAKGTPQLENPNNPRTAEHTRRADQQLAIDQATGKYVISDPKDPLKPDIRVIPPGGAIVVYTLVPQGKSTLRTGFNFEVLSPPQGQPLDVDVYIARKGKTQTDGELAFDFLPDPSTVDKTHSGLISLDAATYEGIAPVLESMELEDPGDELHPGTDFESLLTDQQAERSKATDINKDGVIDDQEVEQHNQEVLTSTNQAILDAEKKAGENGLSKEEQKILAKTVDALKKIGREQYIHILRDEDKDGQLTSNDIKQHNIRHKLDAKAFATDRLRVLRDSLEQIPVGRVNGVMKDSRVESTISPIIYEGKPVELNYAFNTKISDQAGTPQDQSLAMEAVTRFGDQPANLDDIAHGNYGSEFVFRTELVNNSQEEQTFYISFGSPEEYTADNASPKVLSYQEKDTGIPKGQTRFTGEVSIQEDGSEQFKHLVLGNVQSPQHVHKIVLKPGESRYLTIKVPVATNSTGPATIRIGTEKTPLHTIKLKE